MRDYQRQKTKYILPRAVYHATLWIIRDYQRMKDEADAILTETPEADGMPRGTAISDPVHSKASRRELLLHRIHAIDKAKEAIPPEYRKGIWNNIQYESRYPYDAARSTYGLLKSKFIYDVAANLKLP